MINQIILVGRLGGDPEVKEISNNTVCTFSLATTEKWTDKKSGGKKEETEWSRCVVWGDMAINIGNYCKKGSLVYVEGKNKTRKWTDKNDIERYTTEINVRKIQFLDPKQKTDSPRNYADDIALHSEIPF